MSIETKINQVFSQMENIIDIHNKTLFDEDALNKNHIPNFKKFFSSILKNETQAKENISKHITICGLNSYRES